MDKPLSGNLQNADPSTDNKPPFHKNGFKRRQERSYSMNIVDKHNRTVMSSRSKMDRNTRKHFITLLDTYPNKFLGELSACMKQDDNDKVDDLLSIMEAKSHHLTCVLNYFEGDDETETLLHTAVKYEDDSEIIKRIINICPELLSRNRELSVNYRGQTPLHISITRGDLDVSEVLLECAVIETERNGRFAPNRTKLTMMNTPATGALFANTVMMGELPLSVAALTFNEDIVTLLLSHGASLHAQNTMGDTVFHSLVKYSAVYPNKTDDVILMFKFLVEKMKDGNAFLGRPQGVGEDICLKEDSYVWFLRNDEHLTPFQLSAKLGVVDVFQFIINLDNVYSFVSTHDGLFDVKLYDITEIDTVANQHIAIKPTVNDSHGSKKVARNIDGVSRTSIKTKTNCSPFRCTLFEYPEAESVLEMMFDYHYTNSASFRIIETTPVKNVILHKWQKLRVFYFLWGILHLFMTICLTSTIVIRSDLYANATVLKRTIPNSSKQFADAISWLSFIVGGGLYFILCILLLTAKVRRTNASRYIFHNLGYLLFLLMFSVCLFVDFFMTRFTDSHDNIALILAVIVGWWFTIFFLRAIHVFGFFTEMIWRVIFGDMFRFAVIISFMLFAFTAAMYAVFVGKVDKGQESDNYIEAVNQNFDSFGGAMMTMFKLMLGLGDIEVLNEARMPGFAVALYVVFALLTYVLLINSLIAMMSQTCAIVLEDRYPQWRLQQLSVILFMEDILCLCCIRYIFGSPGKEKEVRGFDPVTKQSKLYTRYFFTIHSLQTEYASEEDREAIKKTVKQQQQFKLDESQRFDSGSFNLTMGYKHSIRKRPTTIREIPSLNFPNDNTKLNRKKSKKQSKQLRRVVEEDVISPMNAVKLGSEPDLIRCQKSPEIKRRRYNSENIHEKRNRKSPQSVQSVSSENVYSDGPLTPVDLKIHVHNHHSECPERRESFIPNGYSHVDIEPYPHASA